MSGEHKGHRQRLRERFLAGGLTGFAPHEVLELLLCYAIPQRNVNPLAHKLIEHFGSLSEVMRAEVGELMQVKGIGEYTAILIALVSAVMRMAELEPVGKHEAIRTRVEAMQHCLNLLKGRKKEHFYVVCLDGELRLIRDVLIGRGTISEVTAYPRLVAEAVLRTNAQMVILCHNHPGGTLVPSQRDMDATRSLGMMLEGMGVSVADHVLVADDRVLSMVDSGLINRIQVNDTVCARVADPSGERRIRRSLEQQEEEKGK